MKKKREQQLTRKQKAFCRYYVELGNETQAGLKAGYAERSAAQTVHRMLKLPQIQEEIKRLMEPQEKAIEKHIATAQEVMEYFTKVMNGEIKDQFGLEASLSDRTRAAQELAKRTVDIENRNNGTPDTVVGIKLDWSKE